MLLDMGEYQDENLQSSVRELVHTMLQFDPSMRPSAVQVMDSMKLAFGDHWKSTDSETLNRVKDV